PTAEGSATKQPEPDTKQAEAAAEAPAAEPAGEEVAAQPAIDQETADLATEEELTPVSAAIAKDPAMWARVTEEDPGERTQVIPLVPVAWEQVTRDLRNAARALGDDDRPAFGPGEQTQVIFRRPPSEAELRQAAAAQAARDRAAQEQSLQAFRDLATQERARQALADRAARAAREQGEDTQVIRLAEGRDAADTAEPPGDLTQVLFTPAPDAPAPAPQEPPAGTSSIVGEERPDPADDPTTRLAQAGRQGGSSAAGFGYDNRTTSFLGLERPADEIAGDPTRRLNIPGPREPHDEEEPTRRT
ncbi:MAG TPA: hypothetical protein VFR35_19305, partial [Actinoplanes sp.]|nr:hypothetical protein [Actinoplanes sp.]